MRTKHILAALALPALFAACTNDDFEQIQQNPSGDNSVLQGRAKGYITLAATKGEANADTRIVGDLDAANRLHWMWEGADDKLGAVVVDYAQNNAIVDIKDYPKYAITNYPFAPNINGKSESADFSTPGAVVSGAYMFYNKYDGTATQRRVIGHKIDRLIEVEAGAEAGLKQVGTKEHDGQNFFISPIVDLAIADGSDIEKPISLNSVYSVFHIQLTTDLESKYYAGNGFKVNKVVLETTNENGEFVRSLVLNPSDIANVQKKIAEKKEYAHLFKTNGAIDAMNLDDAEIGMALNLVNQELADPTTKIGTQDADVENTKDLVYQLKSPFAFTSKSQTMDLLIVIPSGVYNNTTGLEEYGGKTQGALKMTVYTSEGTYTSYIGGNIEEGNKLQLLRGYKYPVRREMIIGGGRTNINLFDPNEGFYVETTADYNYAIEYINEHYRDFGNASNWKTPDLYFVEGKTIDVDAAHYFPEFPINYIGNATLQLKGQDEYVINPENVILATGEKRPTIQVKDQKEASISFVGNDATLKLISDAKVVIADKQTVNFEKLVSNTALEAGKEAKVIATSAEDIVLDGDNKFANGANVTLKATGKTITLNNATVGEGEKATLTMNAKSVVTTGKFNLNANSVMGVTGTYTNQAEAQIAEKAVATLNNAATNKGSIVVEVTGELIAKNTFTNAAEATLTLNGAEKEMNVNDRSKATINVLVNNGTIDIIAGGDKKGTYGGNLTVLRKVTNNAGANINVNGEFFAKDPATGVNEGVITLKENPYAMIQLNGVNFESRKDGYIFLADPTQYEMFDSYYSEHNELTGVKGDIITELTNDELVTVWSNYEKYNSTQEAAWTVINKIWAVDMLGLLDKYTSGTFNKKNLVLKSNSGIEVKGSVANFNKVEVEGNAELKGEKKTLNVADVMTIAQNAKLVNGLNLHIAHQSNVVMLAVNGELENNGNIDTDASADENTPNNITTVIQEGASIVNKGYLSHEATAKYSGKGYDKVQNLVKKLKSENNISPFRGSWNEMTPRVDIIQTIVAKVESAKWNDKSTWETKTTTGPTRDHITAEVINKILKEGTVVMIEKYQAIVCEIPEAAGYCYVLYLGQESGVETLGNASDFNTARKDEGLVSTATDIANGGSMPCPTTTWFYVQDNFGTLDLTAGKAWGEIQRAHNFGNMKGDFENNK